MKAAAAKTVLSVDFSRKRRQQATVAPTGRIPRVARMLALAHKIDAMVRSGQFRDYADAARRLGLSRARVTQITSLVLLAPTIQEAILSLPLITRGCDSISERQLRPIAAEPDWNRQLTFWRKIHGLRAAPQDTNGREVPMQDGPRLGPAA